MKSRHSAILLFLFALGICQGLHAQANKLQPEPYEPDEFPEWAVDLRRAEIVSVGSFPLTYLFASLAFDIGRYIDKLSNDPANSQDYAPLFFGNSLKKTYTQDQQVGVVLGAVGTSIVVALVDFFLGLDEKQKQKERDLRRAAGGAAQQSLNNGTTSTEPSSDP